MSASRLMDRYEWGALGLIALLIAQALSASLIKTATFDEPAHIAAGLSYLGTREFKINQQHPPLLKEIGALPLLALGVRWPLSDEQWARVPDPPPPFLQWDLGYRILSANGPARVLFWSRLPFIAIGAGLGWLIWAWGRRLAGPGAALAALALFALDPTVVAHTALVTTDVGFAAAAALFSWALWTWLNDRTLKRLLGCGAALGLALASKFSAIFLVPVALLLMLGAVAWIPAAQPRRRSTMVDPYASEQSGQRVVWVLWAAVVALLAAAAVVYATYFFPANPFLYIRGLLLVNKDHDPTYWPYMAGRFAPRFLTYYLVAFLLKAPIGTLLLVGAGLWALLRGGIVARMDRAFLLVPPAMFFIAYTAFSDNLGIRYLIPAFPFLYLVGGIGFIGLWRSARAAGRLVASGACLWLAMAAFGIYPDHLSYFNELACGLTAPSRLGLDGGSRCGPAWLDDSNVDWGQGVRQLKNWVDAHPTLGVLHLSYFGSMRPEDERLIFKPVGMDDLVQPAEPGRYAISGHLLARTTGMLRARGAIGPAAWLLGAEPRAVVGHAYYIFDVPQAGAP